MPPNIEHRIQLLLDSQWDALESRNTKVRSIREDLGLALRELAENNNAALKQASQRANSYEKYINSESAHLHQREELEKALQKESQGDLAQEIIHNSIELEALTETIDELQKSKAALESKQKELNSTLASRKAKYEVALEDINKSHSSDAANLVQEANTKLRQQLFIKKQLKVEYDAAVEGLELWIEVVHELNELDSELKGLHRDQLPQVAFLLSKSTKLIQKNLEKATEAGWSVLTVAIGHELQVLLETEKAIEKVFRDSQGR